MIKRCAIINEAGTIVNVAVYCTEKSRTWQPPAGHTTAFHEMADVGDRWDHKKKELIKVCRSGDCTDKSHETEKVHAYKVFPEHKY